MTSHITLQTQVYDLDQYDKAKDLLGKATSLAGNISVSFPVVAPFVAMRLDVADDSTGFQILQTGHFICLDEPREEGLILKPNMDIYHKEPQGEPFVDGSYAVYSIRKVDYQEPFWEIDQEVAKLLSELDGKGNSSRAPVDFLRDTMEGYTRLEKYKGIMSLKLRG
jgi:hypothetical protein